MVSPGVKLEVSIHTRALSGGRNGCAIRATNVVSCTSEPTPARATI
jgi:hypothetical protein